MRAVLFSLILFSTSLQAGIRHLGVKNLSLEYASPKGEGTVDKIEVGLSKSGAHTVEVEKIENTFVVNTPVLEFTWIEPWKFLLDAEKLSLGSLTLSAGKGKHALSIASGKMTLGGEFSIKNLLANCEGTSELPDLEKQVMEDCRDFLRAEADRFDVPLDGLLVDVLTRLPQPEEEAPLKNFTLSVNDGDFYMYFLASYVVRAGLRTWGAIHFEDEQKTLVIRVDLIKFGILPVTSLVMRELKDRIKDPRVEINPPLIKVRLTE